VIVLSKIVKSIATGHLYLVSDFVDFATPTAQWLPSNMQGFASVDTDVKCQHICSGTSEMVGTVPIG
jgi:hypothetical protein